MKSVRECFKVEFKDNPSYMDAVITSCEDLAFYYEPLITSAAIDITGYPYQSHLSKEEKSNVRNKRKYHASKRRASRDRARIERLHKIRQERNKALRSQNQKAESNDRTSHLSTEPERTRCVMPNTSKLSTFLKAEHCKDGDIISFDDAGTIFEKEFKKDGRTEKNIVLEMTVGINGEKKIYSPNKTTIGILNEAWGTDTEGWIGKQGRIVLIPSPLGKNMIVVKPV